MLQPCLDSYSTTFSAEPAMIRYHERLTSESKWQRMPVSGMHIAPLNIVTTATGAMSFAAGVSQDAIDDTVKNLGLAANTEDGYYPVRDVAYKSLLDRAKIGGSAQPKLERDSLAGILNSCLALHSGDALLLVRDEKISAFLAGDDRDYSVLPIDKLLTSLTESLSQRFPGYAFETGYTDHALTTAVWSLPGQRKELLEAYDTALVAHGQKHLAGKLTPGVRFCTSDVGVSAASVSAMLNGGTHPMRIGSVVSVEHRRQAKVEDFDTSLNMLFAQFEGTIQRLTALLDVVLLHPVNAMTAVCKRLSMPKKAALEAISMFQMANGDDPASAHDVYMAMQEILYQLKCELTSESKLISVEESLCRALTLRWDDYDLAMAVSY